MAKSLTRPSSIAPLDWSSLCSAAVAVVDIHMNKHRFKYVVLFLFSILAGCAAPGSAIGLLSVEGNLSSENGEPLKNQKIEFILPASYGFGGLDLVMNQPKDFGHKDQKIDVTTDSEGNFKQELGGTFYHVDCWLFPPVGCYPKAPPAPFVLARIDESSEEYYAIDTYSGEFKIYNNQGQEIALEKSKLVSLSTGSKKGESSDSRETIGIININKRTAE